MLVPGRGAAGDRRRGALARGRVGRLYSGLALAQEATTSMNGSPLFRRTLVRVMTVQILTLLVLWFFQTRYAL